MMTLVKNYLKNIPGYKTNRKLLAFAVDDYGNLRVRDRETQKKLSEFGMPSTSVFDRLDSLETENDLAALFDVLSKFRDKNNNPACFSAYALCCNPNYEEMANQNFTSYISELLTDTFKKVPQGSQAWEAWQYGMKSKMLVPAFHGREHLNVRLVSDALKSNDSRIRFAFANGTFSNIEGKNFPSYYAAFDQVDSSDTTLHKEIIVDGLQKFEQVFGFKAINFNAPGGRESHDLHQTLLDNGIQFIDSGFEKIITLPQGKVQKQYMWMGKSTKDNLKVILRNAVFEPASNVTAIADAFKQIQIAFKLKNPVVVSSHRVNFSGGIEENNRKKSLADLQTLLNLVQTEYPDVEFVSTAELGNIMKGKNYV